MAAVEKKLAGSGILYTDRRNFYLSPNATKELWPAVTPFTTTVSASRLVTGLQDPIFKQFEHRSAFRDQKFLCNNDIVNIPNSDVESDLISIDGIVGLPSSVDDSYLGLVVEIWNSTETTLKGKAVITSANSSTEVQMKQLGTSASLNTADNDVFRVVGSAYGEGAESPAAWADELKVVWGSTQIFRTSVQVTGSLLQAALRGYSNELARLRVEKSKEHKMHKERAFLFGGSVLGTGLADSRDGTSTETFGDTSRTDADGNKVRTTMGLVTALNDYGKTSGTDQNVFTITEASYKYSSFVDDMEKVFQYYPNSLEKVAFCGPGAISYFSKIDSSTGFWGKSGGTLRLSQSETGSLGYAFRRLETPHGVLKLVNTPVMRGPYNKYMVVVSDENLSYVQYRPMKYSTNIKTDNAPDLVKDEYFSDEGVGLTLIESHSMFKIS